MKIDCDNSAATRRVKEFRIFLVREYFGKAEYYAVEDSVEIAAAVDNDGCGAGEKRTVNLSL